MSSKFVGGWLFVVFKIETSLELRCLSFTLTVIKYSPGDVVWNCMHVQQHHLSFKLQAEFWLTPFTLAQFMACYTLPSKLADTITNKFSLQMYPSWSFLNASHSITGCALPFPILLA